MPPPLPEVRHPRSPHPVKPRPFCSTLWGQLVRVADEEVAATQLRLPNALRAQASQVPVTCEPEPCAALVADGIEPDVLGLFVGEAFDIAGGSSMPIPAQVILFLQNLWDESGGDWTTFRFEVRRTYLHELGHFLGLNEEELGERDLL